MPSHPTPTEPDLAADLVHHDPLDADADTAAGGFIVFSLGGTLDEA